MAPNHTVIIVEDDPLIRMDAADRVEETGFRVIEAASADEALEALDREKEDVCVLFTDIEMPGTMNGLQLAEVVSRTLPRIRVMITSGKRPARAIPEGAAFMPKPMGIGALLDLLRRMQAGEPTVGWGQA